MLVLLALFLVGGMYLAVNAKLARAGRIILTYQARRAELLRTNGELTAAYARLTAPDRMLQRATELGFRPARPGEIEYIVVEGYHGAAPFTAPRPPGSAARGGGRLSPAYTETLGEWLVRMMFRRRGEG